MLKHTIRGGEHTKKGFNHIRQQVSDQEVYEVIKEHSNKHEITRMCEVLNASRSSYYERMNRQESARSKDTLRLSKRIQSIYHAHKGIYGAPKIHHLLKQADEKISIKRVQRLMGEMGLRSITKRKWKPLKTSNQLIIERENILAQDFKTTRLNEKWVTDITYIPTVKDGWCYLSTIQDLHSKKIIGYAFSKKMDTKICLQTLSHACLNRRITDGLILHSDLGSQYTSHEYEGALMRLNIRHSFSRKGCPYDNAGIESFHAALKKEEVYQKTYRDFEQARISLFQYIEGFYNRKRIHSSIHYFSPDNFEQRLLTAI